MFRRGAHPLIAADHVGNFHEVVIDDVGQVVSGKSIRFQKYLIIDIGPRGGDPAFNAVFVRRTRQSEELSGG